MTLLREKTRLFLMIAITLFSLLFLAGSTAHGRPVIAAYQQMYTMNFEVWNPTGLPPGWYATFDGFPVSQIAPNYWVYGYVDQSGGLVPTSVAVGSVVPADLPELARVVAPYGYYNFLQNREFCKIADSRCNNMAMLDDPMIRTVVAWRTGDTDLKIWVADRWMTIRASGGQKISQALSQKYLIIVQEMRGKNFFWSARDSIDLADLSRSWGFLWRGSIKISSLPGYREDGDSGFGTSAYTEKTATDSGGDWDIGQ